MPFCRFKSGEVRNRVDKVCAGLDWHDNEQNASGHCITLCGPRASKLEKGETEMALDEDYQNLTVQISGCHGLLLNKRWFAKLLSRRIPSMN